MCTQITKRASIKLSHKALNFTQRQDLKVTAGVDLTWPEGSSQPPKTVSGVLPFAISIVNLGGLKKPWLLGNVDEPPGG